MLLTALIDFVIIILKGGEIMAIELFNTAQSQYPSTQKFIRAKYNRSLFDELKKVIDLKQLLCEMGISKNYYINYLNGYSALSMLQFSKIKDFLIDHYKRSDEDYAYFLLIEKIAYCWIMTKIYET